MHGRSTALAVDQRRCHEHAAIGLQPARELEVVRVDVAPVSREVPERDDREPRCPHDLEVVVLVDDRAQEPGLREVALDRVAERPGAVRRGTPATA